MYISFAIVTTSKTCRFGTPNCSQGASSPVNISLQIQKWPLGCLWRLTSAGASSLAAVICVIDFIKSFFKEEAGVCQCLLPISSESVRIEKLKF